MQDRYHRSILTMCSLVLAGGLACRDSTAPDANATLFNQVRGTYELSVVLDSLSYPICPATSPSNTTSNCRDTTVAVSGRRMHAFVTLTDTVAASTYTTSAQPDMYFQVSAGTLTTVSCDTCSWSTNPYPAATAAVHRNDATFELMLEPVFYLFLHGQIANGEITGQVYSASYLGAMPHNTYRGTFVAKRQP